MIANQDFGRVAIDVADDLGYTYPRDLDRRVTAYVREIRTSTTARDRAVGPAAQRRDSCEPDAS